MNDLELEQRTLVPSGCGGRLSHEVIFRFTFGHSGGEGAIVGGQGGQGPLVIAQPRAAGRGTVRHCIVDGG